MKKTDLFNSYLKETQIPKELFPVELYFMKYRAESTNKKESNESEKSFKEIVDRKPNNLKKINYSGNVHFLPTSSLSSIINNEKLI